MEPLLTNERKIEMTQSFLNYYEKINKVLVICDNATDTQVEFYKEHTEYFKDILEILVTQDEKCEECAKKYLETFDNNSDDENDKEFTDLLEFDESKSDGSAVDYSIKNHK